MQTSPERLQESGRANDSVRRAFGPHNRALEGGVVLMLLGLIMTVLGIVGVADLMDGGRLAWPLPLTVAFSLAGLGLSALGFRRIRHHDRMIVVISAVCGVILPALVSALIWARYLADQI